MVDRPRISRRDLLAEAVALLGGAAGVAAVTRAVHGMSPAPDALELARGAARWIRAARVPTEHGVTWAWNPTEKPGVVDDSLYTGAPGVVLFQVERFDETGAGEALTEARQGAAELAARLPAAPDGADLGLYSGAAGVAFVLAEVARASGRSAGAPRDDARHAARLVTLGARNVGAGVEWNDSADIVSGGAGIALALLYLARALHDPSLVPLAARAGRRLVELGEPSHGGLEWALSPTVKNRYPNFSHGTAGVAYALATLHETTGEQAFLEAALAGARYLEAVEDHAAGCRVFHHQPGGEDLYYLSWCHGPAGTARLYRRLARVTHDPKWSDKVTCAARGIVESGAPERRSPGYWNNVSQCCGDAGVGELFLALAREGPREGRREARAMAARVAMSLAERATPDPASGGTAWPQAENRTQPEWVVPQTGFMQGAAGIGAFFLHLHAAERGKGGRVRWPDSPW